MIDGMNFWTALTGPHRNGDAKGDGTDRCIGEVVCPQCQNVMARLLEGTYGIGLRAWIPAQSPSDPGGRDRGWECFTPIVDDHPADHDGSPLSCWRGHGDLWLDGAACREVVRLYRERGKRVRRAAEHFSGGALHRSEPDRPRRGRPPESDCGQPTRVLVGGTVSVVFLVLLLLPVARFVLVVVVVLIALVTEDDVRRETAVSILPMVRSARACAAVAQERTSDPRRPGAGAGATAG